MKIVMFYHSLVSDWNHGNAHFLRGIAMEFIKRGHVVHIYEPENGWSVSNLVAAQGSEPLREFRAYFPLLQSKTYNISTLDLDRSLQGADLVLVHEWNDPTLVRRIGCHRVRTNGAYHLFFHDTHHRAVTAPEQMRQYDLSHYDGVLAYGDLLREVYLRRGWAWRAWTWHEAADTNVFRMLRPARAGDFDGDLVWIGNWGDNERAAELQEFLIEPVKTLRLRAKVFGVRYPQHALGMLRDAGISYGGWLPNYRVPEIFARFRITLHVPRRPYVRVLSGIPTIRPFEALACGIPLVCSPWNDSEKLFETGRDFLVAQNGREMKHHLRALLSDKKMARDLTEHGLNTIRTRHTCAHRVDELMSILRELDTPRPRSAKNQNQTQQHLAALSREVSKVVPCREPPAPGATSSANSTALSGRVLATTRR
jgi:spore maturation protein CgeB